MFNIEIFVILYNIILLNEIIIYDNVFEFI